MLLKKNLSSLLIISLSLIVFSCASVPDVPICKEITPDKGYCSWTLSPGGFIVDEEHPHAFNPKKPEELSTWWEQRPLMLQVPGHSWAEIKKFIIKSCKISRKCRGDVGEWLDKMTPKG